MYQPHKHLYERKSSTHSKDRYEEISGRGSAGLLSTGGKAAGRGSMTRSSSDPQLLASDIGNGRSSVRKRDSWMRGSNSSRHSNMSKSSTRSRGSRSRPLSGSFALASKKDPNSSLHRRAKSQDALMDNGAPRKARTASQRLQELLGGPQPLDQIGLITYTAILNGDVESLKKIHKNRRISEIDRDGNTALHVAARLGSIQCLRWLLRNSHIPVNAKNSRLEACAHQAVKQGHLKCLKSILHCGGVKPLTVACERDRQGLSVLHLAAILGHDQITVWLADAFGKSLALIRNNCGQTALHFAAAKGHSKSVQCLSKLGKQLTNIKDNIGATAAFYASQEGHAQSLYFLANQGKCDLTLATNEGLTPLHAATQAGSAEVARFIMHRVDNLSLEQQTEDGTTVFHMAAANGRRDILRLLLNEKGAFEAVRYRDSRGGTPAHDAAANGHVECLKLLIQAGLDLNLHDQDGETPFSLAVQSGGRCADFVSTLYDGTESQNGTLFNSVRATVTADQMNRRGKEHRNAYIYASEYTPELLQNGGSSKHKDKISMFAKYLRSGLSMKQRPPVSQPEILQGEFLLRQVPPSNLSTREKRIFYSKNHSKDTILLRQKFRPAPISLPYFSDQQINQEANGRVVYDELKPGKPDGNIVRKSATEPLPQETSVAEPAPDYYTVDSGTPSQQRKSHTDSIDYSDPKRPVVLKKVEQDFHVKIPPPPVEPPPSPPDDHKVFYPLDTARDTSVPNDNIRLSNVSNTSPQSQRSEAKNSGEAVDIMENVNEPPPVPPPRAKRFSRMQEYDELPVETRGKELSEKLRLSEIHGGRPNSHVDTENMYNRNLPGPVAAHPDSFYNRALPKPPEALVDNENTTENIYESHLPEQNEITTQDQVEFRSSHITKSGLQENIYSHSENVYSHHIPRRDTLVADKAVLGKEDVYTAEYKHHLHAEDIPPTPPPPRASAISMSVGKDSRYEEPLPLTKEDAPPSPTDSYASSSAPRASPPPPPPPPDAHSHPTQKQYPLQPLAAAIAANRSKLKAVVRRSTPKKKTIPTHIQKGPKVSKKIDHLRRVLEDSGVMAPYILHMMNHKSSTQASSDENEYSMARNVAARSSARSLSPTDRNTSPANPRESNQRFSYLPEGALARVRLTSPDRRDSESSDPDNDVVASSRQSRSTKRHTRSSNMSPARIHRHHDKSESTIQENEECDGYTPDPDYDKDDVERLESTLRRRLEKPQHLPKINPRTQHQYDRVPDPPSELELFFKKRQQIHQEIKEVDEAAIEEPSALSKITTQVEQEVTSW